MSHPLHPLGCLRPLWTSPACVRWLPDSRAPRGSMALRAHSGPSTGMDGTGWMEWDYMGVSLLCLFMEPPPGNKVITRSPPPGRPAAPPPCSCEGAAAPSRSSPPATSEALQHKDCLCCNTENLCVATQRISVCCHTEMCCNTNNLCVEAPRWSLGAGSARER